MKVCGIKDIEALKQAVAECQGDVWLEQRFGDRFSLKSELSQYVAIAELIRDKNEELELFCRDQHDSTRLMRLLDELRE